MPLGRDKPGWRRLRTKRQRQGPRKATADREAMQTTLSRAETPVETVVDADVAVDVGIEEEDRRQSTGGERALRVCAGEPLDGWDEGSGGETLAWIHPLPQRIEA